MDFVERKGFILRSFTVYDGTSPAATIVFRPFSDRAAVTVGGKTFVARQEFLSADFVLEHDGSLVVRAERRGVLAWHMTYEITYAHGSLSLERTGQFWKGFTLMEGGESVGSIPHLWWFRTRAFTLPPTLDPVIQVFVIWLANAVSRRDHG